MGERVCREKRGRLCSKRERGKTLTEGEGKGGTALPACLLAKQPQSGYYCTALS
jgi:hypothetical protein